MADQPMDCHRSGLGVLSKATAVIQQQPQPAGPSPAALREAREAGGRVYLAGLTWWTTDADVEALCGAFGPLSGLQFVEDRATGRSRGAVLVEFVDTEAAARCKEQLHGDGEGQGCRGGHTGACIQRMLEAAPRYPGMPAAVR
ncbi:hypothetical protein GPECTOR_87g428 [Gonium pectorale]|uniref:RRM domain-containing protein n=1 Tax=Gonium pectorale TaxID=33097 RepID=A0A150G242_GONPE|nr:hypothetical protein GPECTOR_87g428 [Gonium pectorale]|eukprot:KXZ43565.1 hypothetical protein GPECTOR_87g428 [Gonium pectorale]